LFDLKTKVEGFESFDEIT
jgi:hypothetical protein